MGLESYTIEELLSYYQQNIGGLDDFDINRIFLVNNLQTISNKYGINESCDNMNGFTVPFDGCIVAILNNLSCLNAGKIEYNTFNVPIAQYAIVPFLTISNK